MPEPDELYIVGLNIEKHTAYTACRNNALIRAAQGVYYRQGADFETLWNTYGIRIANYFFPRAALTHSTAYYMRPRLGRIFVGGDYPYRKAVAQHVGDYLIVQSLIRLDLSDSRMFEPIKLEDPLGEYEIYRTTPEMTLLNLMEATKANKEKHLPDQDMHRLIETVISKHGGSRTAALDTLAEIAKKAGKENEFKRLEQTWFCEASLTL